MIEHHQGKRRRDTKGESDNKHRERPFRRRPTGEKSCYEGRSEAQFACRPLTKDDRNGQKDRGLDDGNCKQFPDFEVSARRCRSERLILKGSYVWKDQKHAAKCRDPENKRGLPERTFGFRLLRRVYVRRCEICKAWFSFQTGPWNHVAAIVESSPAWFAWRFFYRFGVCL